MDMRFEYIAKGIATLAESCRRVTYAELAHDEGINAFYQVHSIHSFEYDTKTTSIIPSPHPLGSSWKKGYTQF